jgi:phage gp45-like
VIDERGRRVAAVARPVQAGVTGVREFGDGLLAVVSELYRDGRRIASYGQGLVLAASRDGEVALLRGSDRSDQRLFVYHHGALHAIDDDLVPGGSGVVAPDGQRILLQYDGTTMIEIDAATRRPLARLKTADVVFDWRPAVVEPA